MALEQFLVGQVAVIDLAVTDLDGNLADPGGLVLRVRVGHGESVVVDPTSITRLGVGRYRAQLPLTQPGGWAYYWTLPAPFAGAMEGVIVVRRSRVLG